MKNKKVILLCAVVLIALLAVLALLANGSAGQTQAGSKNIVFEVVGPDGASESFDISTDAEYLADALVEAGLVEYAADGMYTTINGITADWNVDESWWCICSNGTALSVGMNTQPIADGEHYEAVYTSGS